MVVNVDSEPIFIDTTRSEVIDLTLVTKENQLERIFEVEEMRQPMRISYLEV